MAYSGDKVKVVTYGETPQATELDTSLVESVGPAGSDGKTTINLTNGKTVTTDAMGADRVRNEEIQHG